MQTNFLTLYFILDISFNNFSESASGVDVFTSGVEGGGRDKFKSETLGVGEK